MADEKDGRGRAEKKKRNKKLSWHPHCFTPPRVEPRLPEDGSILSYKLVLNR